MKGTAVRGDGFARLRPGHGRANSPLDCLLGPAFRIRLRITKKLTPEGVSFFVVGEDGFEPSKRNAADLQSVPFGHSGTPPYEVFLFVWLEPVDGLEPPTY